MTFPDDLFRQFELIITQSISVALKIIPGNKDGLKTLKLRQKQPATSVPLSGDMQCAYTGGKNTHNKTTIGHSKWQS